MSAELKVERRGGATYLLINRPERANALDAALVERLIEALQIAARDGTRLVVIRGKGKSFCSGFDLTSVDSESDGDLALHVLRNPLPPLHGAAYTACGYWRPCAARGRCGAQGARDHDAGQMLAIVRAHVGIVRRLDGARGIGQGLREIIVGACTDG